MPRGDGTGNMGNGSMAGRGRNCQRKGNGNGNCNRIGMGLGLRNGQNRCLNVSSDATNLDELTILKNKANRMESNLNDIKARISELEKVN